MNLSGTVWNCRRKLDTEIGTEYAHSEKQDFFLLLLENEALN